MCSGGPSTRRTAQAEGQHVLLLEAAGIGLVDALAGAVDEPDAVGIEGDEQAADRPVDLHIAVGQAEPCGRIGGEGSRRVFAQAAQPGGHRASRGKSCVGGHGLDSLPFGDKALLRLVGGAQFTDAAMDIRLDAADRPGQRVGDLWYDRPST